MDTYCSQPAGAEAYIEDRKDSILTKGKSKGNISCSSDSLAGAVSQRACVYCGARVVLNPVTDAVHLVHGPIGCAAFTWDIRGSLSSGSEMYRNSFSTDMKERDIIFGGEQKLAACIDEIVAKYAPPAVFVYSTCVVGVIGDDIISVCKEASLRHNIDVIPVESSGFKSGNKIVGYRAAADALLKLITPKDGVHIEPTRKLNFLGEYNLGGEKWVVERYLKEIGIEINVAFTGDSTVAALKQAPGACLNLVQCTGSMHYVAMKLEQTFGTPYMDVNFFGAENTTESLRKIADFYGDEDIKRRTEALIERESSHVRPVIEKYRKKLAGKRAAIYVGGAFKAAAIIRQLKELDVEIVLTGTQTGKKEEYENLSGMLSEGTVIIDDANPAELERFLREKDVDFMAGGVKERFLAYKLGVGFVDHNHDRKDCLAGFEGAVKFAREVHTTACSPVWKHLKNTSVRDVRL
ncbi:nitrogenase iron-molybdenum cofactor biosynthesis protein NifE [Methanocella sp. CWC-04]|uniref:Nitrogenase iron-molybdenum cofactor biosynthesis protein NifE n=1 Tax=Methanooceanicella nereidis TaxID=2052831 RepID=A0AAP2RBQ3_9EURY|nr:nitrogenase iron-molybdenum cofactor biosynthesis protein NifE [Methanocella sp. CWC-04]MCD1294294.1 nitrogenase iron-molybdenum cofactor biosynthesis protein NifE [Methanocella sp. CWC-04]